MKKTKIELAARLAAFAFAAAMLALGPAALAARDPAMRPVLAAWEGGSRGVIETEAGEEFIIGQEFPVVRGEEILGIFTPYYIGDFNVWGEFSTHDERLELRRDDYVVVFNARAPKPAAPKPAGGAYEAGIRFGIPVGMAIVAFVDGGTAEGVAPGDKADAWLGDKHAGTYEVAHAGVHYSTGLLLRTDSEKFTLAEFLLKFPLQGSEKK